MTTVNQINPEVNRQFAEDLKQASGELRRLFLARDTTTLRQMHDALNEMIGVLNGYKHEVVELSHYCDEEEWL
mgnify:CR=1 FL=1